LTTKPSSTIEIFRVSLSKGQLRSVPADDRNLLLLGRVDEFDQAERSCETDDRSEISGCLLAA